MSIELLTKPAFDFEAPVRVIDEDQVNRPHNIEYSPELALASADEEPMSFGLHIVAPNIIRAQKAAREQKIAEFIADHS